MSFSLSISTSVEGNQGNDFMLFYLSNFKEFDYVRVNKKLFRSTQNQRKCQTFIMFIDIWEITCIVRLTSLKQD